VSYSAGCRHSSDPMLLWFWCGPAATALIGPLAWEPSYVTEAGLEMAKNDKKKEKKKKNIFWRIRVQHSSHQATVSNFTAFCLYKPLTLSLPWNILWRLPASPELQFSRPRIKSFLICSPLHYFIGWQLLITSPEHREIILDYLDEPSIITRIL